MDSPCVCALATCRQFQQRSSLVVAIPHRTASSTARILLGVLNGFFLSEEKVSYFQSVEEELRQEFAKKLAKYPEILVNRDLCEIFRIAKGTRNRWQFENKLPPRLPAIGRIVRYSKTDLIDWWIRQELQKRRPRGRPTNAERARQLADQQHRART